MTATLLVAGAAAANAAPIVVVGPHASIQRAIDAVGPGGTVVVKPGTYAEHLVITKTVNLVGWGAVLVPPPGDAPSSPCSGPDPNTDGICIAGALTLATDGSVIVNSYVQDVRITGLTITGFGGSGIDQIGGSGSAFLGNRLAGNDEYGIAAFDSTGTTELFNFASGSGEAGFYIGDSPRANATLFANASVDNLFGIFVRDAEHGQIGGNTVHDNCLGVLFLADAPGPDGAFTVARNSISDNTKACPGSADENLPPLSGIGVLIDGAHDVVLNNNLIVHNVPSGDTFASGGVGVVTGDGGTAPVNNVVQRNAILKNSVDILWDGNGTGNVLQPNWCQTSQPGGLCH
ncbi:MAG TPA: right-handed parallel beta-helix repeat-containing protein [Acidimicrobiia bacterium]